MSAEIDNRLILNAIKNHYGFKKNTQFADFLGVAHSTYNSWIARNSFDYNLIYQKCQDINPDFILSGKGNLLKGESNTNRGNSFDVKLVSQYAYAGYLSGYADPEYMDTLPTVPFDIPEGQTTRGSYLAFECRGDSMDDGTTQAILETDIVLGRLVQFHHYENSTLHYKKWFFVIVHETEGIIIKQIKAHDVAEKTITIHSLNELYPDRVLHLSEVKQLYNIVQQLRKNRLHPSV